MIIEQIVEQLTVALGSLGYFAVFILMAIESTVFPLPSELVLIPAGVLVSQGSMNFWIVLIVATLGSLVGSLLSYLLALSVGRKVIDNLVVKYGKFLFLKESTLIRSEMYFKDHGEITIFLSRLLPVIRHLISLPAGFSRMSIVTFSLYTLLGSALWNSILIYSGYLFGLALAEQNFHLFILLISLFSAAILIAYLFVKRKKRL